MNDESLSDELHAKRNEIVFRMSQQIDAVPGAVLLLDELLHEMVDWTLTAVAEHTVPVSTVEVASIDVVRDVVRYEIRAAFGKAKSHR